MHGSGEAIRGNINSLLVRLHPLLPSFIAPLTRPPRCLSLQDGAGDAIAGRSTEQGEAHSRSAEGSDSVATKGLAEIKSGLNALGAGQGSKDKTA